jgi:hypothetical protein
MTTTNTSIPVTKMVNDLFLQWLSLPDTHTTLYTALQSVRTNSKMPDIIIYPKVCVCRQQKLKMFYHKLYNTHRYNMFFFCSI